jgi:hypothetical protein
MKNNNHLIKILTAMVLVAALSLPASAQVNNDEISTLFGNKDGHIDHGGWGALTFGYTQIQGKDTYLMGARGGWLIDHHFTIGLAGNGFISDKTYMEIVPKTDINLAGGYGGLFLEAIIAPNYPVHVTIPIIIGAGGVAYVESQMWNEYDYDYEHASIDNDAFFVFEPGLEVEVNIIKFMRLSIGGSYRYTSQVDMINSSSTMLRGFNGYFGLKFGQF